MVCTDAGSMSDDNLEEVGDVLIEGRPKKVINMELVSTLVTS